VTSKVDFNSMLPVYEKKKKSSVNEIPISVNANFEIALNLKSLGRK